MQKPMQKTRIIISLVAFFLISGFIFYTKKENRSVKQTDLIVGTAAEFPPFEFIENDALVGFDIDLINAIANKMGKEIQLKDMQFSVLIPQLQAGSIDLIAAGMTPTPQRAQQVLFTIPYVQGEPLVIVSKAAKPIKSLQELSDKIVVVNEGFSADLYISSQLPNLVLKRLATVADAFLALRTGNADAFVTAKNTLKPFFKKYNGSDFYVHELDDTKEPSAFAVSKNKPELVKEINEILETMKQDGSLDALKKKWDI